MRPKVSPDHHVDRSVPPGELDPPS